MSSENLNRYITEAVSAKFCAKLSLEYPTSTSQSGVGRADTDTAPDDTIPAMASAMAMRKLVKPMIIFSV